MQAERSQQWQQLVERIAEDYQNLPVPEKRWIAERLAQIEQLQEQLNQLFEIGSGLQSCADCQGDCCAKGHNHMTLVNLLGFLQSGNLPPRADFTSTCPFLGEQGCLLPTPRRPYNCISFVCDIIEDCLSTAQVAEFYSLEQQLRGLYQAFSDRYAGAAMTGLLLQNERLAGRSFFALKAGVTVATISG